MLHIFQLVKANPNKTNDTYKLCKIIILMKKKWMLNQPIKMLNIYILYSLLRVTIFFAYLRSYAQENKKIVLKSKYICNILKCIFWIYLFIKNPFRELYLFMAVFITFLFHYRCKIMWKNCEYFSFIEKMLEIILKLFF